VILSSGQRLADRYTLGDRIAVGGMGEVWRGVDDVLGRPIAVKALRQDLSADRAFQARFREEARTAGGLSHGGIAAVYDYGEDGSLCYLVMELVEGEPLSAMLARSGSLDVDTTLDLIAQTARALHAAHMRGVVHRDVKPANLLVTPDLRVKVTDFGIARPRDHEPLTATGQVMGTAHYLAPELARGEVASPQSDVYALGIVAYECLAGRRPFEGDNQIAVATAQLTEQPPPLSGSLPVPVRRVVESALAKRPQDRPAGAHALAVMLEDLHRARRAGGLAHTGAAGSTAATRVLGSPQLPRGELPDVAPTPAGVLGSNARQVGPGGGGRAGSGRAGGGAAGGTAGGTAGGAGGGGAAGGEATGPADGRGRRAARDARSDQRGRDPQGPDTAVLPVFDQAGRPPRRWRRPSLPLLALCGLVVAAILGAALNGQNDPAGTRTPGASLPPASATGTGPARTSTPTTGPASSGRPTSGPSSPSSTPTQSASSPAATVTVRAADYLGRDLGTVRRTLTELGLKIKIRRVNRPQLPKGRVVGIEPTGSVVQGSTVTLLVSDRRGGG
jgi:eukaryotic-like serine/threonine-protein kinase